jgi:hypothetical protein
MATFDVKKLSNLDKVIVGAGGLALISLFLPWYGVSSSFYSASVSGWSTSYGLLGALLIVVTGLFVMMQRSDVNVPKMSIGPAVIVLGASLLGVLLILIRWVTLPSGSFHSTTGSYSYGADAGLFIALIAGIAQAYCAFRLFRSSGEALPWASSASTTTTDKA